ncbi:FAD-dependent oxidoreductase [Desulfatiglans anilini]|uniref:FAD-dependent oxidoreductase n=1 Tax=Desulfatiglans anilini TaxID=90728 RepID=UPI000415CFC6|nr:FAD-dependent oxidoreductase [Desulfatiglans anilini]
MVREAHVFREKQGIDLRTGHRVERIDPAKRRVAGVRSDGGRFEVDYDKLLLATGASPIVPDLPGFDLPGVMVLKTLDDGRKLKRFLGGQHVERALIVGMGYIALEICETLRTLGIDTAMVKPRPAFLPWAHRKLAERVQREVEENGVRLILGQEVLRIEAEGGALRAHCTEEVVDVDLVLVAIGVKPCSELAAEAGLELGPGEAIAVDRSMRTSAPDIYAAGDCADAYHVVTGEKTWIPLALRANRAGWAVADHISGQRVSLDGVAGTSVFKVFDMQVARTGLTAREASKAGFDPVEVAIEASSRAHSHPGASALLVQMVGDRASGRLLGAQIVGREGAAHRINGPAVALHQQMTVAAYSQCDLAYAPPFGPTWDPTLVSANQLLKKLEDG